MRRLFLMLLSIMIFAVLAQESSSMDNMRQKIAAKPSFLSKDFLSREEIIGVIQNAIDLNEDFKNALNKTESEYREKRAEIEKYHEEVVAPMLKDLERLLSTGRDIDLIRDFFNLLISYENSADERLSYTLGEIFLRNPNLINEAFYKLDKRKQKFIYNQLEWGFENVVYSTDKKSEQRIRDRYELLRYLKSMTGSNESKGVAP